MSSLFGNLSIAVKALMAQQAAIQTTSNNIANVNTPGYTRQRAILQEDTPVIMGTLLFGTGVSVGKVESIRDKVLETAREHGVLALACGTHTVRFRPTLTVTDEVIHKGIEILDDAVGKAL